MKQSMHKQREKEDNGKRERGRKTETDSDRLELVQCAFTPDGKGVEDVARASLYIYLMSV